MKKFWIKKGLMFFTFFIAMALLIGLVVMGLWNAILPAVLGVKAITFIQALGILLLSKILFGGFHGGFRGRKEQWRIKMQEKMNGMTQEEKEKFKAELRNRCGKRWKMQGQEASSVSDQ
jgi:Ca2+/H+ antiporter, TMEM165/GDT1 family